MSYYNYFYFEPQFEYCVYIKSFQILNILYILIIEILYTMNVLYDKNITCLTID